MFRSRRADPNAIDWPSLLSLLEDDDRRAAVETFFPEPGRESFLAALRRLDADAAADVVAAGRRLQHADRLIDWPTIAVAGILNSGKTSLVATFLSPTGRARTLRGIGNAEGTHRFVIWLPAGWKNDGELWQLLMDRIGEAVGNEVEMLADDPEEAHTQYNNRTGGGADALARPLVATDEALDRIGVGLLDCPDIVSDESFGLGSPARRRELLGRAATLCSAFLVVTGPESSRDAALGDLLRIASDLMPGVPRMLAVNKVRPRLSPDQVFEAFTPLAKTHGLDTIYAAYDFEIPAASPFIPANPESIRAGLDPDADPLPTFFSLSSNPDDNPPAAIAPQRLISAITDQLDRGELFERFRLSLATGLRTEIWQGGFAKIDQDSDRSMVATAAAQDCLLGAALEFFALREIGGGIRELRLHQNERIIRQLSESFALTAPWYARWGVRMNARLRRLFGGAGDFVRQLTPTAMAERAAGEIKDKFRRGEYGGLMTPASLIAAIGQHGGNGDLKHWPAISESRDAWLEAAEAAILRFERDDFTALDPRRLDEAVAKMWAEVPTHKKAIAGLTPLGILLASFGGVLMLPVDFGTSFIASASISELMAAAGMTALSTLWSGDRSMRSVGQQAARQQLADLHAVLCDVFGVARVRTPPTVEVSGASERIAEAKIVSRNPHGPTLSHRLVRDEFRDDLQRVLPRRASSP